MLEMKPVVVGMGLYYYMRRESTEMGSIIQTVSLTAYHVEVNVTSDALTSRCS
jgi:hypothetical protein